MSAYNLFGESKTISSSIYTLDDKFCLGWCWKKTALIYGLTDAKLKWLGNSQMMGLKHILILDLNLLM